MALDSSCSWNLKRDQYEEETGEGKNGNGLTKGRIWVRCLRSV